MSMLYKYKNNEINYINLLKKLDSINIIERNNITDIKCNFSFVIVNLKILDEDLKEKMEFNIGKYLKNDKENYYIIGQELFNEDFMNWIFIEILKIEPCNYMIDIIDNSINNIIIKKNKYIKLYKNYYNIIEINK